MKFKVLIFFITLIPSVLYGQLSGSYTIGGVAPDYTTLTQAISALNSNGVSGPVIFNIRNGTYNEAISILGSISGSSSTNTITFQSETLNPSAVIINVPGGTAMHIGYASRIIINKLTLIGQCEILYSDFTSFTNNIYYPCSNCSLGFRIGYSDFCRIKNNIFYDDVHIFYGIRDTFANNFMLGNLHNSFGDYAIIVFNNFGSNPLYDFTNSAGHCLIENNIMPGSFVASTYNNSIRNNDYPFGGGLYDSLPFFIDPQYVSSTDLHSTNPQPPA